jgi:hypothetical protein
MKDTDPLMGAKLKSKTHLQKTFLDFWSRFLHVWLSKSAKMTKFFFYKKVIKKR